MNQIFNTLNPNNSLLNISNQVVDNLNTGNHVISFQENSYNITNLSNNMILMGYTDDQLNRLALESNNYNLEAAIDWIEQLR